MNLKEEGIWTPDQFHTNLPMTLNHLHEIFTVVSFVFLITCVLTVHSATYLVSLNVRAKLGRSTPLCFSIELTY